jgi:1-acyl-sn-glycerol-3-phosphate acyltransferase
MDLCLSNTRFRGMFWAQFLGALNDNVFKNALVILVLYKGWTIGDLAPEKFAVIAGAIFITPFLLFSAWGGQLADGMDKARLVRFLKSTEIVISLIALAGLLTHTAPLLLLALFGFATQSAFFGPVKYGILPQILEPDELLGGNALVETGTSLAILLGTMLGGFLAAYNAHAVACATLCIALIGRVFASSVPSAPAPGNPTRKGWFKANWQALSLTWQTVPMLLTVLGISWFWFFGSMCLTLLPLYARNVLNGSEAVTTLLLAAFSIGIGVGSQACEKLSNGRMELGWVPLGSLGMTAFALDFSLLRFDASVQRTAADLFHSPDTLRMLFDLCGIAISGGLFIVPLYTFIQKRSADSTLSRLLAGNSLWNSAFIIVSTLIILICLSQNVTLPEIFCGLALGNILIAFLAYRKLPEFTLRLFVVLVCKVCYGLRVFGRGRIPEDGACVIVANHVTLVDWLFLASGTDRPVRFVMYHAYYNMPVVHYIFRDGGAIPIASGKKHPEILNQAFESIHEALQNEEMLIIFPEGKLTDDGEVDEFKRGVERILERDPVPVLPMCLKGLWGTRWSRSKDRRFHWRPRIDMVVGNMIQPEDVKADKLRDVVLELLDTPSEEYAIPGA